MEKMKMHTPNFTDENIAKIAELFPNCVTEVEEKDEGGKMKDETSALSPQPSSLRHAIDFDLLKQELSHHIVEGPKERYHLNWPGKKEALLTANAPIAKTLRPCREESVEFDTTENLFIEGDNLDALKLLQESYLGKVKMIYIDPPYNTGKDFIYADNFAESTEEYLLESGQKDEEGNRLVANTDSNGRFHSDWLSMMYSRLKLAKNLLKDDGVIFISIDDNECDNSKKIMDEIFGSENFRGTLIWQHSVQPKGYSGTFSVHHNFVHCYAKSDMFALRNLPRTDEHNKNYSNPDNDPNGLWRSGDVRNALYRPNLIYDIETPSGKIISPPEKGWRWSRETVAKKISSGEIKFSVDETRIIRKIYLKNLDGRTPETLLLAKEVGSTRDAANEIKQLFDGKQPFDTPKPTKLLSHICALSGVCEHDLILDFFAGSSTTAHTVMQLNVEDGGNRKFIMVQLPEACDENSEAFKAGYSTIAEISKERIRRAGKKIKDELEEKEEGGRKGKDGIKDEGGKMKDGKSKDDLFAADQPSASGLHPSSLPSSLNLHPSSLDIGFRVLKVDSGNLNEIYYNPDALNQSDLFDHTDNLKDDRTAEDLLFHILLDWGLPLDLPFKMKTIAVDSKSYEVIFVDGNAMAVCLVKDGEIDEAFCKVLAAEKPLRAVFRDAGFKDDSAKINAEQIFKLLSPDTELKTI